MQDCSQTPQELSPMCKDKKLLVENKFKADKLLRSVLAQIEANSCRAQVQVQEVRSNSNGS